MQNRNDIVKGGSLLLCVPAVAIYFSHTGIKNVLLDGAFEYKRALRYKTDVGYHVFFGKAGDFLVADHYAPAGVFVKLADTQSQCAFAAAGKAYQGQMLAFYQGYVDTVQQANTGVGNKG
jgi:hypothetical protein